MIYINKTGLVVLPIRMGEPTQTIINAGVGVIVLMNGAADKTIVAAGIKTTLRKWFILRFLIRKDLVG